MGAKLKPTIKNLAEYTGKGIATIARWKKNKKPIYDIVKSEFMMVNNVSSLPNKNQINQKNI